MSVADPSEITTRRALPADAALLAELGASTFSETFAADNTPENLARYLAESFGEEIQRAELEDPDVSVFFAERDGEVVGVTTSPTDPTVTVRCWVT